MQRSFIPPHFIEQGFHPAAPFGEIGWPERLIGAVGKINVGDFEVALRAMRGRGF